MPRTAKGRSKGLLEALGDLGLTPLEAEVYAFLVKGSPATGYRIAQAVGKPVGNIYKAVEALEQKGAVLVGEDNENRLVRAVPAAELVGRLERDFRGACETAIAGLTAEAGDDDPDDLLYRIMDRGVFMERCRASIRSAQQLVLISMCPVFAAEIGEELSAAARRGVATAVKVYEAVEIPGVEVVQDPRGIAAVQSGPGQWIEMTVDGREFVQGLLDHDGAELHLGQWTRNPLTNWMVFTGRYADIALAMVRGALNRGASSEEVQGLLERFRQFGSPASAGKVRLMSRYRRPSPAGRRR